MSRKFLIPLMGLLVVFVLYWLFNLMPEGEPEDDQAILRSLVDKAAIAAENRDLEFFKNLISDDYSDSQGRQARQIKQLLYFFFQRGGAISIYLLDKEVEVDTSASPMTASMSTKVVTTRGPKVEDIRKVLPEQARGLVFQLSWKKEEGWKVISARWRDIANVRELLF